jgi:hypothetical protein
MDRGLDTAVTMDIDETIAAIQTSKNQDCSDR